MSAATEAFHAHLQTGLTTVCRAWDVTRTDGQTFGFTDHDLDLEFDGRVYKADTGLSASAVQHSTGLSIDNSEAIGAISSLSITEDDVDSGRFDAAGIRAWLVNWANPEERELQFQGQIGEIKRQDGTFIAELRGLTEKLNQLVGRVYQKQCTTVLGSRWCGVDTADPAFSVMATVVEFLECRYLNLGALDYPSDWFARGTCTIETGAAAGTVCLVKTDTVSDESRRIELWEPMSKGLAAGDSVRLIAGCDKRSDTCKLKFNNFVNFQGFPHIPGEDWLVSFPSKNGDNDGGSLFS